MSGWDNPDVDLLYDINGLAKDAPTWADHVMEYVGEYGIVAALVLLGLWAWWVQRKRSADRAEAVTGVAGLLWAPLAAVVALLVNFPIRHLVERPRPFVDHKGLEVLVEGKEDYSFVSDHSTLVMALAVGIFMVNRRLGLVGLVLAVLAGFCRVYMGVHYPTDVLGGLALGTAVTLLLAPVALWMLTPLVRLIAGAPRAGQLVWAGARQSADTDADADGGGPGGGAGPGHRCSGRPRQRGHPAALRPRLGRVGAPERRCTTRPPGPRFTPATRPAVHSVRSFRSRPFRPLRDLSLTPYRYRPVTVLPGLR